MAVGGGPLFGGSASRTQVRNFFPNKPFFDSVANSDPYHFGKLDPDPHQSEKQDPGPQKSEKVSFILEHWKVKFWRKGSCRIRIRIKLKVDSDPHQSER